MVRGYPGHMAGRWLNQGRRKLMAVPGDKFIYSHPSGAGFGEAARGEPLTAEMTELDLKDGQEVTFMDYDADSDWPMIEWVDGVGIDRITTVDPAVFDANFVPA
jgi:hypothetical protein